MSVVSGGLRFQGALPSEAMVNSSYGVTGVSEKTGFD
jgi:hypothetical protein